MELKELFATNTYIKEGSGMIFRSPEEYIQPFMDLVAPLNAEIQVKVDSRVANTREDIGTQEAYGRVAIIAKLPQSMDVLGHYNTIGMIYALDVAKPIMKTFTGLNAYACTNLCVFNANQVHTADMMQGVNSLYENVKTYSEKLDERIRDFTRWYNQMVDTHYDKPALHHVLGSLLCSSIQNKMIGITPISVATQDLLDNKSKYYANNGETTQWNLYSAITQYVTDKVNLLDVPTKTLAISELFNKLNNHN